MKNLSLLTLFALIFSLGLHANWPVFAQSPKPEPSPSVTSSLKKTSPLIEKTDSPKQIEEFSQQIGTLRLFIILFGTIGTIEGFALLIIGYLYFRHQKEAIAKSRLDIKQTLDQRIQHLLTQLSNQNSSQDTFYNKNKSRMEQVIEKLDNLENLLYSIETNKSASSLPTVPSNYVNSAPTLTVITEPPVFIPEVEKVNENEVDNVIQRFNKNDKDYFRGSQFFPLTLTQVSIHGGESRIDGRRTIQFETADSSQATYLRFESNGQNWLILNISSPYFTKIKNNIGENSDIFTVHPSSDSFQLVKPAKLTLIGSGLWEIEEPGEFQGTI